MSHTAPETWTARRRSAAAHCQAVHERVEAEQGADPQAGLMIGHALLALAQEATATTTRERALFLMQARAYAASALILLGRPTAA